MGNTALILATLKGRPGAMEALLRHGAWRNVHDPDGLTALHHAAGMGFTKGLRLLLDSGGNGNADADVDVDVVDNEDCTPLHHAVNSDAADAVAAIGELAQAGADLEAQDKAGRTPLILAAQLGSEQLVRRLLALGADAQTRDRLGWAAIDYADKHPGVRTLLRGVSERSRFRHPPVYYT